MKRRASRCSVDTTQNRRQKLNGTVTGLTHDRRVDRGKLVHTVSPVSFERPGRAASRSSKLIAIKGQRLPTQIAELTAESGSVRPSGFRVSPLPQIHAQT